MHSPGGFFVLMSRPLHAANCQGEPFNDTLPMQVRFPPQRPSAFTTTSPSTMAR